MWYPERLEDTLFKSNEIDLIHLKSDSQYVLTKKIFDN